MNSTKHSFFCGIEASHEGDSAHAEVVACFERVSADTKILLYYIINLSSVALRRRKILIYRAYDHIQVSLIAGFFHIHFVGKWSENRPTL